MYFGLPTSINQATTIGIWEERISHLRPQTFSNVGQFSSVLKMCSVGWCLWCSSLKYPATDLHQVLFSIFGAYIIYN